MIQLYNDDCLKIMDTLIQQGIKVDSIITDIPYFQVVKNSWDNQWKNEKEYLEWVETIVQKCNMLLKDNASLLLFTGRQ